MELVINPHAGKRRGRSVADIVSERLVTAGHAVRHRISTCPGMTVELAREAAASSPAPDALVVVGGDGTLFELLNGALERPYEDAVFPIPIGIVPVGTGNSFVRDIGVSNVDEAAAAILNGRRRRVDIGVLKCATGVFPFINLLGAGFVSNVAHRADRYKAFGAVSYIAAVIHETIALRPQAIRLTIDGRPIEREALFVEICNSRFTGGAMEMAPNARIDDGLFDVVVMKRASRRKLLSLFPSIFSGRHVDDPLIEVFRGAEVTVETDSPWLLTPDGETFGTTPLSAVIRPKAVEVFVA